MVEFLRDIAGRDNNGETFTFEKGKRYVSISDFGDENSKDKILIRQPNSPDDTDWWSRFPKDGEGVLFRTVDQTEMSTAERIKENRILQRS